MEVLGSEGLNVLPFYLKRAYYFASVASLGLIAWVSWHFGETNLPPLLPVVRNLTLALYANWFLSYALFVSDPGIENEKPSGWIWLAAIGACLSLMRPVFSGDLLEYLIRGRMLGIYHVSPYRFIPLDFPNDLLRPYSVWVKNPDSYGPLSVYLQTLPAMLFKTSITGMIWAYKMMILGFYAVAVVFFWKIIQHLRLASAGRLWAMFAYCPLFVVLAFIDGHNDILMVAFSVISLYFLLRHQFTRAFVFWTLAFLVKYMVAIHLPFMILYALRHKWSEKKTFPWRFIAGQLILNLVLIVACFAPVWAGSDTFLAIFRQKGAFYTNTFPYLFYLIPSHFGVVLDQQFLKTLFLSLFGAGYLYLLARCWKGAGEPAEDFFRILSLSYLAFYLSLPSPMGSWYMLWAVPWIVLARWNNKMLLILLYSAAGLLGFYKRYNFLFAGALMVYGADWLFRRYSGKSAAE